MKKLIRNEAGQSAVLVVLMLAIILGCAALGIDAGRVHIEQQDLQNAVDLAALAGASKLPSVTNARTKAEAIAAENGAVGGTLTVNTPYNGDTSKVEVIYTTTLEYTFAKVIGYDKTEITVRAVAERSAVWDGEALPFVNFNDDYEANSTIYAWDKNGNGFFESIWKKSQPGLPNSEEYYELQFYEEPYPHFVIAYRDGICVTKGKDNSIGDDMGTLWKYYKNDYIYLFSIKSDLIKEGYNKNSNKDVVDIDDLVLLKVKWVDLTNKDKPTGNDYCTLEYTGEWYNVRDIMDGLVTPENLGGGGSVGNIRLVE
ncbi:MAG: hypothetical protein HUJ69_05520 [Lachnospiraceae bacterium]|nr:hypothetical protein [Lachnospiraceae bacterium]